MKRKTLLTLIIVLVLVLTSVLAFSGCKKEKHPKDNSFVGCISQTTYEDETSATRGFLTEELDGVATQTQFVNAEKGKALSSKEISNLNLGEDIKAADVESATYYTVKYTEATTARAMASSPDSAQTKSYEIIVLKVGTVYHYYVPIMREGTALTNSYIANICNPMKYLNFTETVVAVSTTQAQGISPVSVTISSTLKFDWNKAYMSLTMSMMGQTKTQEFYILGDKKGLHMYAYDDYYRWWDVVETLPYDTFEDYIVDECLKFDHSYFERTSTGFRIREDRALQYIDDILSKQLGNLDLDLDLGISFDKLSGNYYVKNAKLDEIMAELSFSATTSGVMVTSTTSIQTKFSDYGTTVVELPPNMG